MYGHRLVPSCAHERFSWCVRGRNPEFDRLTLPVGGRAMLRMDLSRAMMMVEEEDEVSLVWVDVQYDWVFCQETSFQWRQKVSWQGDALGLSRVYYHHPPVPCR